MSYQPPTRRFAAIALVLCLAGSVLTLRKVQEARPNASLRQTLYIQSPEALRRMSLGYTGLMASVYWTRAVQYFGSQKAQRSEDLALLYPLLHITTELDPKMSVAYEFGSVFLAQQPPWGSGQPDKAVELIKRGIEHNPNEWRLYYQLGFIEYLDRKDYEAAAQAFEAGSKLPNAHPWLKILAAKMRQEGGSLDTARSMWQSIYESSDDENIKKNALMRLAALRIDEEVLLIEQILQRFEQAHGRKPASLHEMVQPGYLRFVPKDPEGREYALYKGQVITESQNWWPFITKGIPPVEYEIEKGLVKPKPASN